MTGMRFKLLALFLVLQGRIDRLFSQIESLEKNVIFKRMILL